MRAAGPVFAADQHGGYLRFTVPSLRPYIDTRLVLHTATEYADYLALFDDPARFDALDSRENFGAVVLTTAYPIATSVSSGISPAPPPGDSRTPTATRCFFCAKAPALLSASAQPSTPSWMNLPRGSAATRSLLEAARLHLARLLVVLGQSRQAEYVLAALDSRPAAQLRARAHFAAGELRAAEALARILLVQDPRDLRSLALLAEIASADNQPGRAGEWLRRALAIDPYDPEGAIDCRAPPDPRPDEDVRPAIVARVVGQARRRSPAGSPPPTGRSRSRRCRDHDRAGWPPRPATSRRRKAGGSIRGSAGPGCRSSVIASSRRRSWSACRRRPACAGRGCRRCRSGGPSRSRRPPGSS
jgi:tetratricopeptide (TPR) repeat protein